MGRSGAQVGSPRALPRGERRDGAKEKGMVQAKGRPPRQLLHLVFGGELKTIASTEFHDLGALDIVGMYPNYAEAYKAWKAAAQRSVDNAQMGYFIVHIHRLIDPQEAGR
jgi:Domain of unknown function (DUF4170)